MNMLRALRSWLPVDQASKFRAKWDEVSRYFAMVHANNSTTALQNYKDQLLEVEASLGAMMDCLATERREIQLRGSPDDVGGQVPPKCYEMLIKLDTSSPNGVIFHLCQHGKHNEPFGVRRIMCKVLAKILLEADIEDEPLLGHHENVFLPLRDMVYRVAVSLHPSTVSRQVTLADMAEQHLDRVAFAHLLCALCYRLDVNPTFFELMMPDTSTTSSREVGAAGPQPVASFMLLDFLMPYVAYNYTVVNESTGELFSIVLRSLFYLCRLRDDRLQQLLTRNEFLATNLFTEAMEKTTKYLASKDKIAFVTKVEPFIKFLDTIHFSSENELIKAQMLTLFQTWLVECVGKFYVREEDTIVVHVSGLLLHVLSTLRATPYLEAVANYLLCTHFDLFLRRMDDVSTEVSTVTLCLLRILTECAPLFITSYIVNPFVELATKSQSNSPTAILSSRNISALFSKGITRDMEGTIEDYKADIQYRYLRMFSALQNGYRPLPHTSHSGAFFIHTLVRKVEGMLEQAPEVNIVITGILTNLCLLGKAKFVHIMLRESATEVSLQRTLTQLRSRVDNQVETNPKFYNALDACRRCLFGDLAMKAPPAKLSVSEFNLYGACCVLEEFCVELSAMVSLMPMWMKVQ